MAKCKAAGRSSAERLSGSAGAENLGRSGMGFTHVLRAIWNKALQKKCLGCAFIDKTRAVLRHNYEAVFTQSFFLLQGPHNFSYRVQII